MPAPRPVPLSRRTRPGPLGAVPAALLTLLAAAWVPAVPAAAAGTPTSGTIHNADVTYRADGGSAGVRQGGRQVLPRPARAGDLLPRAAVPDLDLSAAGAQWIDAATVAVPPGFGLGQQPPGGAAVTLVYSATGSLSISGGELAGAGTPIRLVPVATGLTAAQLRRYPHLAGYAAFTLDPRDAGLLTAALRGQVVLTERDPAGRLVAATGVQLPGVLDAVYAAARSAELGPVFRNGVPTLSVWAPTAQDVSLELFDGSTAPTPQVLPMRRDDASGVWSVTGTPSWAGRFYLYRVRVWAPSVARVVTNEVTDPYSLSLSTDSARSQIVDLSDPALAPPGWAADRYPPPLPATRQEIQELHIRDFSIADTTVPAALRGTYLAFTQRDSAGMRHLRDLARAGVTTVHLLPAFDFSSVPESRADQSTVDCDLAGYPADSPLQQACVAATAGTDGYDWGYDPWHYTVPEGSYATQPDGSARIVQFRQMVAALHAIGLRVVLDVVYNHTSAAGQDPRSVLDRIVPGYYHRLSATGAVTNDSCCQDTAPEHAMMNKLVVDSVSTWARQYRVDGFRFDLMGLDPKQTMLDVQAALRRTGRDLFLYGEGWNFGVVADDARFVQATQANMAGTGIATFNDRLRDAVRGGGPFDADPRVQGFASGLYTDPNGDPVNGSPAAQKARLLLAMDQIKVGLTGNLAGYTFTGSGGATLTGAQVDYNGSPAGYTASPGEAITYVDAHDNAILYDALAYKLPAGTGMADRVRMQALALATTALSQGPGFAVAGGDLLRSKSLDGNSYNSGDWFNAIGWDCRAGNGFGHGLPAAAANQSMWSYARPLLADPALVPGCGPIAAATQLYQQFLAIKRSTPLFCLGTAAAVQQRLSFPLSGTAAEIPGVITMHLSGAGLRTYRSVTVIFNATPQPQRQRVAALAGTRQALHPVQAAGADPVVGTAGFDARTGTFTVPARTVAVFVG